MTTFEFSGARDCFLEARSYSYNDRLALLVQSWSQGPMAVLTVNLADEPVSGMRAFLDTNNVPDATSLVERLGIGEDTGIRGKSGYCTYPLYEFDLEKIWKYTTTGRTE